MTEKTQQFEIKASIASGWWHLHWIGALFTGGLNDYRNPGVEENIVDSLHIIVFWPYHLALLLFGN